MEQREFKPFGTVSALTLGGGGIGNIGDGGMGSSYGGNSLDSYFSNGLSM